MANKRTDKSCYESRFGAGWISASQYLAENMCSRKARSEGNDLAPKFWQDPYWEKQLLLQLKHANDLLKEFDIAAIIAGLKHPDAKKVYSLGLKSVLIPLIKREQRKLNIQQENRSVVKVDALPKVDTTQKPRQAFATKRSPLQRLRDLEYGTQEE